MEDKGMLRKRKVLFSGMLGNILEFYDFTLYGVFSVIISQTFFPNSDPLSSLLSTYAAFAVGFLARPLGAIFFGHIGDRYGRKVALSYSVLFMALPTLIIGLLPSYGQIGLWAPIILVLCRLTQGVCAGGEYNGSAIFLIEHLGKERASFAGSLASIAGTAGCLLAVIAGATVLNPSFPDWSWRIPFIIGSFLALVGYYIRYKVAESPEFEEIFVKKKQQKSPLKIALLDYPKSVLCCVGGAALSGTLGTAMVMYVHVYLSTVVGLQTYESVTFNCFGLALYILCAPISGQLADKYGKEVIMSVACLGLMLFAYPIFVLLRTGDLINIVWAHSLLCILASGFCGPLNAFMNSLFPAEVRYSGVAFGYGVGMALFGGSMPFVVTFLMDKIYLPTLPGFYIMSLSFVGFGIIVMGGRLIIEKTSKMLVDFRPS
jgi:MHS family proline/betaine transporter-like MFS transporter